MTMSRRAAGRLILALAVAATGALVAQRAAFAAGAGPFGVGLPEAGSSGGIGGGWFSGFFAYVALKQSEFYRALTGAISALKQDGGAFWWLGGLAFLYGIFHAAGPGHGKAVISSYILANRQTLRNGVLLSFLSAFAQAASAIALVSVAAIALGMTGIAMTGVARSFEIGSYAIVTLLGAWLVWSRVLRPAFAGLAMARLAPAGGPGEAVLMDAGGGHENHGRARHHDAHGHGHAQPHRHDDSCGCGHAHMPGADMVAGPLDWRRSAVVIASVGFRPCTGALIALVFALSQGLFAAGIFATFAMALGTGLTVSILAALAVGSRDLMLGLSGRGSRLAGHVHRGLEMAGSVAVLLLGLVLLTAAAGWSA